MPCKAMAHSPQVGGASCSGAFAGLNPVVTNKCWALQENPLSWPGRRSPIQKDHIQQGKRSYQQHKLIISARLLTNELPGSKMGMEE